MIYVLGGQREQPPTPKPTTCPFPSRDRYNNAGCRCDGCRAENAAYHRERRKARIENIPAHVHGTNDGYLNYMCRCRECNDAHNQVFYEWVDARGGRTYKRTKTVECKECGQERLHMARGLCGACYQAQRLVVCKECERIKPHSAHGLCGACYHRRRRAKSLHSLAYDESRRIQLQVA